MSSKYRIREKPVYVYYEYYGESSLWETIYEVLKWNRVIKTYTSKAAATRLKNKLERED